MRESGNPPLAGCRGVASTPSDVRELTDPASEQGVDQGAPIKSDSAQDVGHHVNQRGTPTGPVVLPAGDSGLALRAAYLFSGKHRKSSIATELRVKCRAANLGLFVEEIDIYNGGSSHDLLDTQVQAQLEARLRGGEFDVVILSPPCGTWSRANYSPKPGPKPCRSRQYPWGFPGQRVYPFFNQDSGGCLRVEAE